MKERPKAWLHTEFTTNIQQEDREVLAWSASKRRRKKRNNQRTSATDADTFEEKAGEMVDSVTEIFEEIWTDLKGIDFEGIFLSTNAPAEAM